MTRRIRGLLGRWTRFGSSRGTGHRNRVSLRRENLPPELAEAWKSPDIAVRQRDLTDVQLLQMRSGNVIPEWQSLKEAVESTGNSRGRILEVGCSTGYHFEVLEYLLGHPVDYTGVDYSEAMVASGRAHYPRGRFAVEEASCLSAGDAAFDVVISGCVLLHMPNYAAAIAESARVSRGWVILHRTPITHDPTRFWRYEAYGVECVLIEFNEDEILDLCRASGLEVRHRIRIAEGDPDMITYVLKRTDATRNLGRQQGCEAEEIAQPLSGTALSSHSSAGADAGTCINVGRRICSARPVNADAIAGRDSTSWVAPGAQASASGRPRLFCEVSDRQTVGSATALDDGEVR